MDTSTVYVYFYLKTVFFKWRRGVGSGGIYFGRPQLEANKTFRSIRFITIIRLNWVDAGRMKKVIMRERDSDRELRYRASDGNICASETDEVEVAC